MDKQRNTKTVKMNKGRFVDEEAFEKLGDILNDAIENDPALRKIYTIELYKMKVARNMRSLRKKNKLTQKEVAKLAGLSQPIVARVENPKSQKTPSLETVAKIAHVFGRTIEVSFPKEKAAS